eukprot:2667775-Rhodomonas_salina.2
MGTTQGGWNRSEENARCPIQGRGLLGLLELMQPKIKGEINFPLQIAAGTPVPGYPGYPGTRVLEPRPGIGTGTRVPGYPGNGYDFAPLLFCLGLSNFKTAPLVQELTESF